MIDVPAVLIVVAFTCVQLRSAKAKVQSWAANAVYSFSATPSDFGMYEYKPQNAFNSLFLFDKFWCCRVGLNYRPLPYQGSALPLSYGS